MIRYGKLLLAREKDNPSPILRATYLFSNVGDLIKCYGRMIRFPDDAELYKCEIKLALGDIMMQCRMIAEEHGMPVININEIDIEGTSVLGEIRTIATCAARTMHKNEQTSQSTSVLISCHVLCIHFGWNTTDIEHLGYQHVKERFEQFEKEGWI